MLDGAVPLASGSWKDAVGLKIDDGQLLVELGDEFSTGLQNPDQFVGYTGKLGKPQWSVLLINHGLHIDHHGRSAAGGADPERALRAQRRQRALGLPLRCAIRHRCHPGSRWRRKGVR
ncbi:malate synthase G [Mycobacteroides abscessus subsp. abscessus]|nr:malate synthase G [Mycobacteroides abscessus subsp. abscessus]